MLKQILDQKIEESSLEDLREKLGYQSTKRLQKSIDKFTKTKTIYDWLNSGFYDLVNNAEDFLIKLCKVLKIENQLLEKELIFCEELKVEIEKFKDCYIFINTNFKRKSEPIFVLALLENKRRISLYKNEKYLFKSLNEILNMVSNEIIKHYIFNNGKCFIFGNIVNYQLHLFGNLYTFTTNGKLIDDKKDLDVNIAFLNI